MQVLSHTGGVVGIVTRWEEEVLLLGPTKIFILWPIRRGSFQWSIDFDRLKKSLLCKLTLIGFDFCLQIQSKMTKNLERPFLGENMYLHLKVEIDKNREIEKLTILSFLIESGQHSSVRNGIYFCSKTVKNAI